MSFFTPFAADLHGAARQVEFANEQLCGFLGAGPRVVQKQQQSVVAVALGGFAVRGSQKCIHLRFIQIRDYCLVGFLEGNGTDLTAPVNMFRIVLSDEARQSMNRGQPLVASGNRTLPRLFQVGQEAPHQVRRQIDHVKSIDGSIQFVGNERNQQRKGITVAALRVTCEIALRHQVFEQEAPYPGA